MRANGMLIPEQVIPEVSPVVGMSTSCNTNNKLMYIMTRCNA